MNWIFDSDPRMQIDDLQPSTSKDSKHTKETRRIKKKIRLKQVPFARLRYQAQRNYHSAFNKVWIRRNTPESEFCFEHNAC